MTDEPDAKLTRLFAAADQRLPDAGFSARVTRAVRAHQRRRWAARLLLAVAAMILAAGCVPWVGRWSLQLLLLLSHWLDSSLGWSASMAMASLLLLGLRLRRG